MSWQEWRETGTLLTAASSVYVQGTVRGKLDTVFKKGKNILGHSNSGARNT